MKTNVAAGAVATTLATTLAAILATLAPPAAAQDAPLLDQTLYGQLERWLGAGPLYLDNLYTRQAGDDSLDFHAAVDGRGSNFTIMSVSDSAGASWIVGGYNPQSWFSDDGWHVTERDWQRTGFIFNYTDPAVYRQVPTSNILPSQGSRQTFNRSDHGPTFGAGPDLFVDDRLSTSISWQLTYGDPDFEGRSIIDGTYGGQFMRINALEIYAVSPIPEPHTWAMLLGGLGLIGWAARLRRPA
jgi:hypothetical protein